jgi:hypothetical protein
VRRRRSAAQPVPDEKRARRRLPPRQDRSATFNCWMRRARRRRGDRLAVLAATGAKARSRASSSDCSRRDRRRHVLLTAGLSLGWRIALRRSSRRHSSCSSISSATARTSQPLASTTGTGQHSQRNDT